MAMRALLLDGSREGDRAADGARAALLQELARRGWRTDTVALRDMEIAPCMGCFGCWVRSPGVCVIDDAGREVARLAARCDMLVFFTRLTFGGHSSELKKAVDRLIPNISPLFMKVRGEVHHRLRYPDTPRMLAVGLAPEPNEEANGIFRTLVERNAVNMHSPAHAAAIVYDDGPLDAVADALDAMEAAR